MKINSKGAISVTLRNDDMDLRDFINNLPERAGSDILRAVIRDGIEHQSLKSGISPSNLSLLCQFKRLDLDELVRPFYGDVTVEKVSNPITTTNDTIEPVVNKEPVKKKIQGKSAEERADEIFGDITIYRD